MHGESKRPYFQSTKDRVGKEYEELMSSVTSVLQQSAAIIRSLRLDRIMVIIDEYLLDSEGFCKFLESLGSTVGNIMGLYIPEEEEIIDRLVQLGDDKLSILRELRKYGNERTIKVLDKLESLETKYGVRIVLEILHKPGIESIIELAKKFTPDLIVFSKNYLRERDRNVSSTVIELISRLEHPILLVS